MTVAFDIKYPWFRHKPWPKKARRDPNPFELRHRWKQLSEEEKRDRDSSWPEGYRDTFITIWHVDPEKDGSDDSCGYSYPKITKAQREVLRNAAWSEAHEPHFLRCGQKEWNGTISEAEFLYRGLVLLVARVLRLKLTMAEITRYAAECIHVRTCSKAGEIFCFLPGYHTNFEEDSKDRRQDHFHGILCGVARGLLDLKRPWWKHPKWHVWHWKFQILPLQSFKRWAFSRCSKCGGRIKWGESVVSQCWDSTGPLWFRTERHIECERCSGGVCAAEIKPVSV